MKTARKIKSFDISENEYEFGTIDDFGVIRKYDPYYSGRIEWMSCRDEFADYTNIGRFLFHCNNPKNTMAFVKKIESVIGIPTKNRVKFRKTNKKNILYVSLSDFWKTIVHRSLLTILLRAGHKYNPKTNNWKSVIENDEYLKHTKHAIARFLSGHTRPTLNYTYYEDRFTGWVDEFKYDDETTIKSKLRKNV